MTTNGIRTQHTTCADVFDRHFALRIVRFLVSVNLPLYMYTTWTWQGSGAVLYFQVGHERESRLPNQLSGSSVVAEGDVQEKQDIAN